MPLKRKSSKRQHQLPETPASVSTKRPIAEILNELNGLGLKDKDLSSIDEEKILELRKELNPYGRTIAGSDQWLSFSLTQIHHEYWKKFLMTSLVGFLHRMVDEWHVPPGVPIVPVYDFLEDPKKADPPQVAVQKRDASVVYDYEYNKQFMEKRLVVKAFLEEMFQFNPDEHVKSAYKPNYHDPNRSIIGTMAGKIAVDWLAKMDPEFRKEKINYEQSIGMTPPMIKVKKQRKVKQTIIGRDGQKKELIKTVEVEEEVPDPAFVYTDQVVPTITPAKPTEEQVSQPISGKDPTVKHTVLNNIPPADVYAHFKRYYTENYEELRDAVKHLYCERPELELAINPYAVHDTKEEADAFRKQHANEVIAEVFTVQTGKWNFFDSFKQQRESVEFYNKNTAVLEEMMKQIKRDEELGQKLMEKRVQKEKKKNVIEAGKDAPNLKTWQELNPTLQQLGAKRLGGQVSEDTPEEALEVPIWRVAKGGTELVRDKMYTLGEAPTFMRDAQEVITAANTGSSADILAGKMPVEAKPAEKPPAAESRPDNL